MPILRHAQTPFCGCQALNAGLNLEICTATYPLSFLSRTTNLEANTEVVQYIELLSQSFA